MGVQSNSGIPATNVELSDFTLNGQDMNHTGYDVELKGLETYVVTNSEISNIYIYDTPATGWGGDFIDGITATNVIINDCGNQADTPTSPYETGCNGFGIGIGGFNTEPTMLVNCIAENIAHNGFLFERISSDTLAGHAIVTGCEAINCTNGFTSIASSYVTFSDDQGFNNRNSGVELFSWSDFPSALQNPVCVNIQACTLTNNVNYGVALQSSSVSTIGPQNCNIENNIISGSLVGIELSQDIDSLVSENQIVNCPTGMSLASSTSPIITSNTIIGYTTSIYMDVTSSKVTLINNQGYNPLGVQTNFLYGNSLVDSTSGTSQAFLSSTTYTVWDSPKSLSFVGYTGLTVQIDGATVISSTSSYTTPTLSDGETVEATWTTAGSLVVLGH